MKNLKIKPIGNLVYDKTRYLAIVQSMTEEERGHLDSLDHSKIKRIARGSGRTEVKVKTMIEEFRDKK